MEWVLLDHISEHKGEEGDGGLLVCGLTKAESCTNQLVTSCDKMTGFVDKFAQNLARLSLLLPQCPCIQARC